MTKEIKFRGKDISNGSWRYGYYFSIKRNGRHFIKHPELFNDYEVDQSSVGQFTGLKDKNGVEIYEGDVLKGDWGNIAVIYDDRLACYRLLASNDLSYWVQKSNANPFEVIGNIHEKGGSK